MIILEKKIELTEPEKRFFDDVQGNEFPWFYTSATDSYYLYAHSLMIRDEENPGARGIANSPAAEIGESFFMRVCKENNIKVKTLLRMCVNATGHCNEKFGDPHVDHLDFKHNIFLYYINQFDQGSTYLLNDNNEEILEIKAEQHKAVIFPGMVHAQGFPGHGQRRIVFVATYI